VTPGQEALAEAARLESGRIYSRTLAQHRREHETPGVTVDEYDRIIDERRAAQERGNVLPLRRRTA
jgi:hypothetical protein